MTLPKNTVQQDPKTIRRVKKCSIEFPSFRSLRHHKQRYHTAETTTSGEEADTPRLADADDKVWKKSYSRVGISSLILKYKKGDIAFNFAVNNLSAQVIEEKLYCVLDKLNYEAKLNLVLDFILKAIEEGKFIYFYTHENNTLLEQSKLVSDKDEMAKLKEILRKTDVIESCTKGRSNTKWRFFKLTKLTMFAALLRDTPKGCKDAVLPDLY